MGVRRSGGGIGGAAIQASYDPSLNRVFGTVNNTTGTVSGLTVTVSVDGTVQGTATTSSTGAWTYSLGGIASGSHTFLATVSIPVVNSITGTVTPTAAAGGGAFDLSDANQSGFNFFMGTY